MTNFEMYKDELMEIDGEFSFDKNTRKIGRCDDADDIDCENCIFNEGNCFESDKLKWLYSEYKNSEYKTPILSDDELELIKALNKAMGKEYKYAARDTDGLIRFFEIKPSINVLKNYYNIHGYTYIGSNNGVLFSNITHKDGLYDIKNKCFIKEEGDNKND